MNWHEGKIDELRRLWAVLPQLSASAIGTLLGMSRNAVLGKANRCGLKPRRDGSVRPPRAKGRKVSKPTYPRQRVSGPAADSVAQNIVRVRPPVPRLTAEDRPSIGILELTDDSCRWPTDDRPARYCGDRSQPGSSYCEAHERRAWRRWGGE